MIVDLLVQALVFVLTGVFGLLPAYSLPSDISTAAAQLGTSLAAVNGVVPVATMGVCLAALIGARVFLLAWSATVWIYRLVPLKFT